MEDISGGRLEKKKFAASFVIYRFLNRFHEKFLTNVDEILTNVDEC